MSRVVRRRAALLAMPAERTSRRGAAAGAGFRVVGYDLDPRKAAAINKGESYIPDVSTADVQRLVDAGRLSATTDEGALDAADAVLICVPTPLGKSKDPDMSFIAAAVETVTRHLHPELLVGFEARFIGLAGQINGSMPHHVVSLVADALNGAGKPIKGSRILLLGVAYKRDVDDLRESPALDILALLAARGADLTYADPFVPAFEHLGRRYESVPATTDALSAADCVVVLTDHSAFDWRAVARVSRLVVDTRNALKDYPDPKIHRL